MTRRESIFAEIAIERDRQDRQWGGSEHDDCNSPSDWMGILVKHLGKAVHWPWTARIFRHQMVVVAAVALAAVEWAERDGETHERADRGGRS